MTPRTPTGLSVASPGYNYPDTPHYVDNPKLYDVIDRRYVYAHMDSDYTVYVAYDVTVYVPD